MDDRIFAGHAGDPLANNVERNPQIKGGTFAAVINNFIYNPQSTAIHYMCAIE